MSNPLHASQENVARAKRKFGQLKAAINGFLQSNPYSLRAQREAGLSHIIARREKDLDIDIAFDVVDLVLRLRSALDKATVALVASNSRGTSGVGFPFGGIDRNTGQPDKFPSERMIGKHGLKKKLSPEQWDFICAHRPYPGGNNTLWAINEIANADKHREGLVEVSPNLDHGFAFDGGYIDRLSIRPTEFQHLLSDEEREVVLMSMGTVVSQSNIQHSFSASVVFGDGFGADRRNVLATLNEQIRIVDHILKGMRRIL